MKLLLVRTSPSHFSILIDSDVSLPKGNVEARMERHRVEEQNTTVMRLVESCRRMGSTMLNNIVIN